MFVPEGNDGWITLCQPKGLQLDAIRTFDLQFMAISVYHDVCVHICVDTKFIFMIHFIHIISPLYMWYEDC